MRRGDHMIILEQQILLERQVWLLTWNSLIATAMILHRRLLSQEVLKSTITLWYYCYCFCSCQWFFYLWVLCPWRVKIPKDKDYSCHTSHRMQRLINQSEQVYLKKYPGCSCNFSGSYYGCRLTMHTSFSLCCALILKDYYFNLSIL